MTEREIFEAVYPIRDPEARERAIVAACRGDAALRARVDELLRLADRRTTAILDPAAAPPAPPPAGSASRGSGASDPLIGQSIGGVKLVRVINEGGMGRVYEGRQESPRRTVAVKLVKPGVATEKLLRRFEFEAQVLARLRHPGIAEIFYAGTFGEGKAAQPFFVMEYIANAKPLTQYASDLKLSTHDRLELFRKVCDAVAHGHHNGVIHRDLKPSNILVDATGQPKVIDFGVAKTTDSDMALTTLQTDVGALIGTYQYMSPEQFDADPHAIDIRSDVYALGVVLYELLAGQPPYDLKRKLVHEIGSIVRQQDPTPLTNVNKTLRRDVGVIAGKCLEKDRNRRYSSAGEVAADVARYLAGDPIAAVAPSAWDALMRVAKRHKAAATAVVAVAASLVAAVVGISVFAVRARQQERAATLARESEAEQRLKAEDSAREAQAERERAEAESTTAKRQLYAANLYKLQTALDRPQRTLAKEFFQETFDSFKALQRDSVDMPVELRALAPDLDGSIHVLEGHEGWVDSVCFSPDGKRLATASGDNSARLWDASTGTELAVLKGHEDWVESVCFSPDGKRVATASRDNSPRLWDASTGTELAVLKGHERFVRSICFSPDGKRLATASDDRTARLWDASTGTELAVLRGHRSDVTSICFSPDGKRLATASSDHTARLWDASTGTELAVLKGHEDWVDSVCFSPDGKRLATASSDKTARLWDASTGAELAVLKGHDSGVRSICFSPDGKRLATASSDHTARLWDASTGTELAVLEGHDSVVTSICFSPDGKRLATASKDRTARLWGLSNAEIHRNRLASAERRERLGPIVDEWFAGDLDAVKEKLLAAKQTMPPEDWHEAGNLVLTKARGLAAAE